MVVPLVCFTYGFKNVLIICLGLYALDRFFEYLSMNMYKSDVIHYWHYVAERYAKENGLKQSDKWRDRLDVWLDSHNLSYYKRKCPWIGLDSNGYDIENHGLSPDFLAVRIFDETVIKDKNKYLYWGYALQDKQGRRLHRKRTFWESFREAGLIDCICVVLLILLFCFLFNRTYTY